MAPIIAEIAKQKKKLDNSENKLADTEKMLAESDRKLAESDRSRNQTEMTELEKNAKCKKQSSIKTK